MADPGARLAAAGTSTFLNTVDALIPSYRPERPGAYLRISDDPLGLERGVRRQRDDAQQLRRKLQWARFAKIYEENDTSAFKKRKVRLPDGSVAWRVIRPEFRRMLDDLLFGVIDGLIVYDLDRLARQPRDLEDLIDVVEQVKRPVQGVTGTIDLMTSNGRTFARLMTVINLKSSEDTSRRVARAAVEDARNGKTTKGGSRRYGWEGDGHTLRNSEAEIVREMVRRATSGESLWSICLDLQARGVKPVKAARWSRVTINAILRSPRIAGIRSYGGRFHEQRPKINDWQKRAVRIDGHYVQGNWEPIIAVDEWEALQAALDANRDGRWTASPGHNTRKYLLTGIARCDACDCRLVGRNIRGRPSYGCLPKDLGGCNGVSRNVAKVDALVMELAIRYLEAKASRPARQPDEPASNRLAKRLTELEERKAELRRRYTGAQISDEDFYSTLADLDQAVRDLRSEKAHAEQNRRRVTQPMLLREELLSSKTSLSRKRAILGELFIAIKIKKSSRGPHFSPADIVPIWRPE